MTALFAGPALAPSYAQGVTSRPACRTSKPRRCPGRANRHRRPRLPGPYARPEGDRPRFAQPEFSLTYAKYVGSSVSPERIARASRRWRSTAPCSTPCRASTACRRNNHGVLGLRQLRASFMGDFQVVRSVATLGCMTAHRLLQQRDGAGVAHPRHEPHDPRADARLVGGRHGQHAVHALDLHEVGGRSRRQRQNRPVDQPADSFASAANFLRGIGFKPACRRARKCSCRRASRSTRPTPRSKSRCAPWAAMGVKRAATQPCPMSTIPRRSSCPPAGAGPPSFSIQLQGGDELNRSTLYALAVGILARQIAGGPPVMQAPPADDEPLSRDTVIAPAVAAGQARPLYRRDRRTFGTQDTFGVRLFQKQVGLPADGHPTPDVVRRLQQRRGSLSQKSRTIAAKQMPSSRAQRGTFKTMSKGPSLRSG